LAGRQPRFLQSIRAALSTREVEVLLRWSECNGGAWVVWVVGGGLTYNRAGLLTLSTSKRPYPLHNVYGNARRRRPRPRPSSSTGRAGSSAAPGASPLVRHGIVGSVGDGILDVANVGGRGSV